LQNNFPYYCKNLVKVEARQVYIAYAHADKSFLDKLSTHLNTMERQGLISAWTDEEILAGEDYLQATEAQIANAQIIMLLVSADFLASDFCVDRLLQPILQKHAQGTATVIPIIVRYCDWYTMPFAKAKALPLLDGKVVPIKDWADPDKAYYSISQELRKIVQPKQYNQQSSLVEAVPYANVPETTIAKRTYTPLFVGGVLLAVIACVVGYFLLQQQKTIPEIAQVQQETNPTPPQDTLPKISIQESNIPDEGKNTETPKTLNTTANNNTATKPTSTTTKPVRNSNQSNPAVTATQTTPVSSTSGTTSGNSAGTGNTTPSPSPKKVTIVLFVNKPMQKKSIWIDDKEFSALYKNEKSISVSNVPVGEHKIALNKDSNNAKCSAIVNIQSENQELKNFNLCF